MISPNSHITAFLDYYCEVSPSPQYAVLIKGLWGSGKTWFINKYTQRPLSRNRRYLYVSLYGIKAYAEIEAELFRQIHPILSSPGVKLTGKIIRGMIKTTINIDLDGDGKTDTTINASIPNEKLIETLKISDGSILIFDDLERCAIPTPDVLGYINQFVERCDIKAIIVANEQEIIDRENDNARQAYHRTKEKLIAKSFEFTPELEPAVKHFLSEMQNNKAKVIAEDNIDVICQIYIDSGYKNLRILKNSLLDFDRLIGCLSSKVTDNKGATKHLLTIFLAYSFEVNSGSLLPTELRKLRVSYYASFGTKMKEDDPNKKFIKINSKYNDIRLHDSLLSTEIWEAIFSEGSVASENLEQAMLNSSHFQSIEQPDWVRLWHGRDLSDEDFDLVLHSVLNDWRAMHFKEIGEVKHIAGILFWLSDSGLYKESKSEILGFSKIYINDLRLGGYITAFKNSGQNHFESESWAGLGYQSRETTEFIELQQYIAETKEKAIVDNYPREAEELLATLSHDPDKFIKSLLLLNDSASKYSSIPILFYVDATAFTKKLLELPPSSRRSVGIALLERYKYENSSRELIKEVPFLENVREILQDEVVFRSGKISSHTLNMIIEKALQPAIVKLKAAIAKG